MFASQSSGHPYELEALIEHILSRYHEVHRQQLPGLVQLAHQVQALHPDAPSGLCPFLEDMAQELLSHMAKEEMVLFPLMKSPQRNMAWHPIQVMRSEHTGHSDNLTQLATMTGNMVPPPGASEAWQALYAGLRVLHDDLTQHIQVENDVLFPMFGSPAGSH